MKIERLLMTATIASLILGCGRGEDEPPTSSEFEDTRNDEIVTILCEQVFECPERQPLLSELQGRFTDMASCKQAVGESIAASTDEAELSDSLSDGRQVYDADAAQECLEQIAKVRADRGACELDGVLVPACDRVYRGTVILDGACVSGADCVDEDAFCASEGNTCGGTCESPSYKECGDVVCDEGEFCDEDTCAPFRALGAACGNSTECGSFSSEFYCDDAIASPACAEAGVKSSGDACRFDFECGPNLECNGEPGSARCGAPATIVINDMGGACEPLNDDGPGCKPGLVCRDLMVDLLSVSLEGTCQPAATLGQSCYFTGQCAAGLRCADVPTGGAFSGMPGACADLLAAGQSCDNDLDCESLYCDDNDRCGTRTACTL